MNIIVDGLAYFLNKSEAGDYVRNLINSLNINNDDNVTIIKDREIRIKEHLDKKYKLENLYVNRINKDYSEIREVVKSHNGNIYHCLNNGFSMQREKYYNCSVLTTITNIIPEEYEEFYNLKYLEKYYYAMELWDSMSENFICPSEHLKNKLINEIGINENRIKVLKPIITPNFIQTKKNISRIYLKSRFNFNGDFILYCGDIHPRKRLLEFLEIFEKLIDKDNNLYFLILGYINDINYSYYELINEAAESLGIKHRVIFITSYNKADKVHFYNMAKCVIDFSIYENFNISLMEARNCGANIICSNIAVFRESLGNYPLYLDMELPYIYEIIKDYMLSEKIDNSKIIDNINNYNLYRVYEEICKGE